MPETLKIIEEMGGFMLYGIGDSDSETWRILKPIAESPVGREFDCQKAKKSMTRLFVDMEFFGEDFRDLAIRDFSWLGSPGCWTYRVEAVTVPKDVSDILPNAITPKPQLKMRHVVAGPGGHLAVSENPIDTALFSRGVRVLCEAGVSARPLLLKGEGA